MRAPCVAFPWAALLVGACAAASTRGRRESDTSSDGRAKAAMTAGATCYQMQVGPWTESRQRKGLIPPTLFQLDTTAARARFAPPGARAALPTISRRGWTGHWVRSAPDSLVVGWSNGFALGGYRLAVHGDSVVGLATTWSDARTNGALDPVAPAAGRRIGCPPPNYDWPAI